MGDGPAKPISLYPLTPAEALRRAMAAPVPKKDHKPPVKPKAKKAAKKPRP